jgi:2-dehydro-3-deoxyphosphogluconate aldolase / (4S)-4-hydroxy-2-oxoglutarate aldolase
VRALSIRDIMLISPVIPVLTVSRVEHALPLARALVRGGVRVLELTLRTHCALDAIASIRAGVPEAVVGAGTLTRLDDFGAAGRAGAQFGVTPGLTPALIRAAALVEFPLLPGVMTPAELIAARESGYSACKLFPAQAAGGLAMLRALAGPFPDVVFCPTGGITPQNAADYLAQPNVLCVGGSWLAPSEALEQEDWPKIESLAREAAALREP